MTSLTNYIAKLFFISAFACMTSATKALTPNHPETQKEIPVLELEGKIVIKNKELKGSYKVEVMLYNSVTSTILVKNNAPLKLHLKKGTPYILKISKKGFFPRYICLNTNNCEDKGLAETYSFYLETDFIETSEAMRLDNETLEMPAAIISFDKTTCNFDHNKDYASFVNRKILNGLQN